MKKESTVFDKYLLQLTIEIRLIVQEGWRLENDDIADSQSELVIKGIYHNYLFVLPSVFFSIRNWSKWDYARKRA